MRSTFSALIAIYKNMFKVIKQGFNNFTNWIRVFLDNWVSRTLFFISVLIIGFVVIYVLKEIIIDTLKEPCIDKRIKSIICILAIIALIVITILVIMSTTFLSNKISGALN